MTIHVHKGKTDNLEPYRINLLQQMRKERTYLAPFPELFNSYLYFQTLFFIRKGLAE